MLAVPVIFVAITLSPLGVIGHWISLGLFIIANLLLWSAMVFGFYLNAYNPRRLGKTTESDGAPNVHDDRNGEEP